MSVNPYTPPSADLSDESAAKDGGISLSELQAFTGKCSYPAKLKQFHDGETRLAGFNYWAAFFGTNWFVFRKLYFAACIAVSLELGMPVLLGFLLGFSGLLDRSAASKVGIAAFLVARTFIGFYANVALGWKAFAVIRKVDALNLDNQEHLAQIGRAGGISMMSLLAVYVLLSLFNAADIARY